MWSETFYKFNEANALIFSFLVVGLMILFSAVVSQKLTNSKIPYPAVAIFLSLFLAYWAGDYTGGEKGLADIPFFAGFKTFGGAMFRDFSIVATGFGASLVLMRKSGKAGMVSLLMGLLISFGVGVLFAYAFGYRDAASLTTIGAGACTYIVGPVTGSALGVSSEVIALSIAAGVFKAVFTAIATPLVAKKIGLDNPKTAMVYGGMIGTNTGVMAGLASTDVKLIPYGAMTATFYTGLGCLLCPSVFYLVIKIILAL